MMLGWAKCFDEGGVNMAIQRFIDHTLLAADATKEKIEKLCKEALEYHFASVCVNSCWVKLASEILSGSDVAVCTVVGFPLGAMDTESKAYEAEKAVADGADEIDMVINIGYLRSGMDDEVLCDIKAVREACLGKVLKVIIEACLLTDEEKIRACRLAEEAGADFVKTSTGFSSGGAAVADVALMRKAVGGRLKVKAAGGIRTLADARAMIGAGASRIGASAGIAIVREEHGQDRE